MSLDDLATDVQQTADDLETATFHLDAEARTELAMLAAAMDNDDPSVLLERAIHALFQQTVDAGKLDFHLRANYDVTYDEYLSGMTYDEMTGGSTYPTDDGDRRYQF
ncbi:hypothetical protein [Halorubellus salinus]|uniref:hypothetical protein n=1 Tax=Halorubellus salinus TaxID=755309 RepID=UPI001D061C59|nr:hypothetical protein [Halorubellus salinus]